VRAFKRNSYDALSLGAQHGRMQFRRPTALGGLLAGLLVLIVFVAAAVAIAAGGPSTSGSASRFAAQAGLTTVQPDASAADGDRLVRDVRFDGGEDRGHHR
jgi:hypothetical protein